MIPPNTVAKASRALPFWASLGLVPIIWIAALYGGWALLLPPLATWWLFMILDLYAGLETDNADLETTEEQLFWYRLITLIWFPVQFVTLFGALWYISDAPHLNGWEKIGVAFGLGVVTGTIGINYSHELMHQKSRLERWFGDLLLATVLYSHFRSEHLLVHHRYVGTPKDAVTARYNEGFHRYFPRVLRQCLASAFEAEAKQQERRGRAWWDGSNPFIRYWLLQLLMLVAAYLVGGWIGLGLFVYQSFIAIWQLELVNYIEHYGLTRKHLGDGRYEHVMPRHSWNAAHKASNWLLINLQRHSDHHYKPDRRFPLLQNYTEADAPQLPHGYPLMTLAAMVPPLWRQVMNPRVRKWREMYYPEITDWRPYSKASNPAPAR